MDFIDSAASPAPRIVRDHRSRMLAGLRREEVAAVLPLAPGVEAAVAEADLAPLPEPARRYMRLAGVVGRPRDWSFRAHATGRFRPRGVWLPCEVVQYNARISIARIFHMRLRVGLVPAVARDTYVRGYGRMLVKALDLVKVVDATGPELDLGELVTWLDDAVLIAPSMLLGPAVTWAAVDDASFDVSLADRGRTVTARVSVDAQGAVTEFSTTDRFFTDPSTPKGPSVRTRWTTPVEAWRSCDGRRLPARAGAVWHPPAGPYPYADFVFEPGDIVFNVAPGA